MQGVLSAAPEMVNHSHEHVHSHHHGVDMNHPVLALSMTVVSIAVKEGYTCFFSCFIILKPLLSSLGFFLFYILSAFDSCNLFIATLLSFKY